MTVDQLKNDLLLLSVNVRDLLAALNALGASVSVTETTSLLSRVPAIRFNLDKCEQDTKGVSNVSDSDAESVLNIVKTIVPDVAKVTELMIQKKDAFAQLPSAFSIEGLFDAPSIVGGTLIRVLRAQIEGVHARVAAIANTVILLAPSSYTEEAKSIKAQLDVYFQQAITAYSS